ncbi:hypothetical protein [Niallia nealsonii]|uniref:Uncharacterized protein n=1 Tax=Niallia nealsonii TaxID=115979 RepID=A0A2N0Z887_9BACI|nr:hypothetical protein [Niallia nealsonii]PKG25719.1 hypothetical protein CWS01_00370 [Niallia nealsonii]
MNISIYIFSLLNIFALGWYLHIEKIMTPLVRIGCYLISFIFVQDWTNILASNLNYLELPNKLSLSLISVMNKVILLPIASIFLLEMFLQEKNYVKKIIVIIAGTLIMVCLDYSNSWLKIIQYHHWGMEKSFLLWFCFWTLLYGLFQMFIHLEKKENQ